MHLARTEGRLVLAGACLLLQDPAGETTLLAWPSPGTTWNAITETLTVDGTELRVGDGLVLGGGEFLSPVDPSEWVVPPTPQCWSEKRWLVEAILGVR